MTICLKQLEEPIRLEVADQVYEYHGGGWTDPFLCEQVIKTKPIAPKDDFPKYTSKYSLER